MDRSKEVSILKEMAKIVGESHNKLKADLKLVGFLAAIGQAYKGDLAVYGRAVNEWVGVGMTARELSLPSNAERFATSTLNNDAPEHECLIRLVTDYTAYSNSSAFWRVAKKLVNRLNVGDIETPEWSSTLAWSNLYKIAPYEGGNPSERLCGIQEPKCLELFSTELSTLAPKRIVFATGLGWAGPFLNHVHGTVQTDSGSRFVEAYGEIALESGRVCKFVVAPHPQGKPEEEWVDAVMGKFKA